MTQRFASAFADLRRQGLLRECAPAADLARGDLARLTAVRQVDSKFIVAQLGQELVVLVDQHAAGERVELERLQRLASKGDRGVLQSVPVPHGASVPVTPEEQRWLAKHRLHLERWGFRCLLPPGSLGGGPAGTGSVVVTHVPDVLGTKLEPTHLKAVLAQAETSSGGTSVPPAAVSHILAFKACRRAVKFGDPLSDQAMARLLRDLGGCEMPFWCAHGRPTVYPLLSLPALVRMGAELHGKTDREPPLRKFLAEEFGAGGGA